MFTGIVEGKGKILRREYRGGSGRLTVEFPSHLTEVQLGDSISINGVCLTVTEKGAQVFQFDLSEETTRRSTLSDLREGDPVNLERALRLNDRVGGHFVTGHIDGTGVITERRQEKEFVLLRVKVPDTVSGFVVAKGSIAIDGISLTVNECRRDELLVTLIPYTLEKTTLMGKKAGDRVNLEADLLAKYVERLLNRRETKPAGLDRSFLERHGFTKGDESTDG